MLNSKKELSKEKLKENSKTISRSRFSIEDFGAVLLRLLIELLLAIHTLTQLALIPSRLYFIIKRNTPIIVPHSTYIRKSVYVVFFVKCKKDFVHQIDRENDQHSCIFATISREKWTLSLCYIVRCVERERNSHALVRCMMGLKVQQEFHIDERIE
jgi:hypothetical protein